jgi:hypothetical protein
MSNDNIWGMLSKKKKNTTLTVPTKPTPKSQSMEPVNVQPAKVKPVKVKAPRIKPVQAQARPQTPVYQNTDFKFMTSVDQAGISILTYFQGKLIHKFILPQSDYALFVGLNPQLKFNYVQMRVSPNAFWNDMRLVHAVIQTIVNVLDALFAEAARIQQQQQR